MSSFTEMPAASFGSVRCPALTASAPPFYQRASFWLTTAALIALLVYGATALFYRRRLQRQQRAVERLRTLERERDRIAGKLHDDLGTGLSSIRFLSEEGTVEHLDERCVIW